MWFVKKFGDRGRISGDRSPAPSEIILHRIAQGTSDMEQENKTEMKILSVVPTKNDVSVVGKMVDGDVYDEIYFMCVETGGIWRLAGRALASAKGHEEGLRLIGLRHVQGNSSLEEGYTLVSSRQPVKVGIGTSFD